MSPQAQIIARLRTGATTAQLIAEGFKRSTVYNARTLFLGVQAATQHNRTAPEFIERIRVLRVPPHSLSLQEIASEVGLSVRTVHNAVRDLPLPPAMPFRGSFWTPEQDAYLRQHYRSDEREALVAALRHPWNSIVNRASRFGLHRDRKTAVGRPVNAILVVTVPRRPATDAVAEFIATRGVTLCPPVGSPDLAGLPPLRWDRKTRRATRRVG